MVRKGKKVDGPEGMKSCYKAAKESGDREEEARWANQIGHAYKDRGDYVEALTWFRLDYDISVKRQNDGPRLNLMPTCQSLGEIYHRLGDYGEALHYQVQFSPTIFWFRLWFIMRRYRNSVTDG